MISVYCGDYLLYDPRLDDYKLPSLKLTQELNKADTLIFEIYPSHPSFSTIAKLKPTLTVYQDGSVISRLRVLDEELNWENGKKVTAEGPLAWLNDSIQRPFSFPINPANAAPADYFTYLLNNHNGQVSESRQLEVGTITVTDPNGYIARSDTEYSTTFRLMKEGLIDTVGGYIVPRYTSSRTYLDYLADFNILSNQPVQFGLNMLSIKTSRPGKDIATAILPLGAVNEETGERLTISSLADSTTSDICKSGDFVYSKTAEALYGSRIMIVEKWDDVTIASNLLTKATARLGEVRQMPQTITLTAADLSAAGYNYNTFSPGTYVDVIDDQHDAHDLLARYLVKKLSIDVLHPENNTLTLGATTYSMSEKNQNALSRAMYTVETNIIKETAVALRELEQRNMSALEQNDQEIRATVTENYYTKGETNDLVSSVSSQISQTASGWNLSFNSLVQDFGDAQANTNARFEALQQYIRLEGGNITLGEVGNPITLTIENDQIGIYRNGVAVTYWNGDQFLLPNGVTIPVGGTLTLGSFAFIPRSNGSLDFTWVGD